MYPPGLNLVAFNKINADYDKFTASVQDADEAPLLEIDLLSCPDEGTTPLHDTLNNGHLEIAKLLLEKGGVELLYVTDKQVVVTSWRQDTQYF